MRGETRFPHGESASKSSENIARDLRCYAAGIDVIFYGREATQSLRSASEPFYK